MIIGVITNLMTFVDNSSDQPRITLGIDPDQEEGRLDVCRFENVQNLRSPFRIRPVVECDRDFMFAEFDGPRSRSLSVQICGI